MLDILVSGLCLATTGSHLVSSAIAAARTRPPRDPVPPPAGAPRVTILRPVCGVDTFDELTLGSTFALDYPDLEIIFCCDRAEDPAAHLVTRLIERHPRSNARLLIGRDPITANPKLNNLLKAWPHVSADWVIMADSNVDMPRDYVQRLLAEWQQDTGVLCAPPIGARPADFAGEVECAFLNTYQARWQYAADTLGFGFAQGKTMMFRRRDLEAAGGLVALGSEPAEDAAATKLVRGMGLNARLVDGPFAQPLGPRTWKQVWDRQARWARLRRMTFPVLFVPEILTSGLAPILCAAWLADGIDLAPWEFAGMIAALWYGAEVALARLAGWQVTWRTPFAALARDVLLPALWLQAWLFSSFSWRGNDIDVDADEPISQST
ncbi:MAG: ceramide glucosyltransferase [Hyphomicrobiales bacterium]|nr:MAG: ceramide glucosyltransferase [Hyphomicrobiales bacterium]